MDTEQNSRRAKVRMSGILDMGAAEDAHAKVLQVIKENMKMRPPLSDKDVERRHWLGRQSDTGQGFASVCNTSNEG